MDDTHATAPRSPIGRTALGRLHLRVPEDVGFEEVLVERRWPDVEQARAWCEKTVARTDPATEVLEIQVFEESWQHSRSWETAPNRPVAESLQLGLVTDAGHVRWSSERSMTPRAAARHVY